MSVGTLVTVNPKGEIIKREPIWPFPEDDGTFPRTNADGTTTYFYPRPYYEFPLRGKLDLL